MLQQVHRWDQTAHKRGNWSADYLENEAVGILEKQDPFHTFGLPARKQGKLSCAVSDCTRFLYKRSTQSLFSFAHGFLSECTCVLYVNARSFQCERTTNPCRAVCLHSSPGTHGRAQGYAACQDEKTSAFLHCELQRYCSFFETSVFRLTSPLAAQTSREGCGRLHGRGALSAEMG